MEAWKKTKPGTLEQVSPITSVFIGISTNKRGGIDTYEFPFTDDESEQKAFDAARALLRELHVKAVRRHEANRITPNQIQEAVLLLQRAQVIGPKGIESKEKVNG